MARKLNRTPFSIRSMLFDAICFSVESLARALHVRKSEIHLSHSSPTTDSSDSAVASVNRSHLQMAHDLPDRPHRNFRVSSVIAISQESIERKAPK